MCRRRCAARVTQETPEGRTRSGSFLQSVKREHEHHEFSLNIYLPTVIVESGQNSRLKMKLNFGLPGSCIEIEE